MEDILELFEFDDEHLKAFFESYLDNRNELISLKACSLTFKDLTNWKNGDSNYNQIKTAIDDYFVGEVESNLYAEALSGNYKSAEFILKNRSALYSKDKKEESIDLSDLLNDVIEEEQNGG